MISTIELYLRGNYVTENCCIMNGIAVMKGKHLKMEDRIIIEILLNRQTEVGEIALELGIIFY